MTDIERAQQKDDAFVLDDAFDRIKDDSESWEQWYDETTDSWLAGRRMRRGSRKDGPRRWMGSQSGPSCRLTPQKLLTLGRDGASIVGNPRKLTTPSQTPSRPIINTRRHGGDSMASCADGQRRQTQDVATLSPYITQKTFGKVPNAPHGSWQMMGRGPHAATHVAPGQTLTKSARTRHQ